MIKTVGVLGAGLMGCGISLTLAKYQYKIFLWNREGTKNIEERIRNNTICEKMNKEEKRELLKKINFTTNLNDLSKVDLILESVIEKIEIKEILLKKISEICRDDTIISTNTSTLSVNRLSSSVHKPQRFIGTHFFNPPNKMRLVEVIKSKDTSSQTVLQAMNFVKNLDKVPVLVKDSPGFIVNRLLFPLINDAVNLLEEGVATQEDIDIAMKLGANFPVGPLELADLVGLDVTYEIINELHKRLNSNRIKPNHLIKDLIEKNRFGRKNKKGFYSY